jgi:hypothetical protein
MAKQPKGAGKGDGKKDATVPVASQIYARKKRQEATAVSPRCPPARLLQAVKQHGGSHGKETANRPVHEMQRAAHLLRLVDQIPPHVGQTAPE